MPEVDDESPIYPFYTNIGKFVVEFEQNCHTIESGIRCILALEGLGNEKIQEILIAGLEAEQLRALFQSLCYEYLKPDAETAKIIDYVLKTFQELISVRNDLIHGKWFMVIMNGGEGGSKPIALGQKLHRKKTGSATKMFKNDVNFFENLVGQALFLMIMLQN